MRYDRECGGYARCAEVKGDDWQKVQRLVRAHGEIVSVNGAIRGESGGTW